MSLLRSAEQGHINILEHYADNAGLSFARMNAPDGRPVLLVELSKSWSLFNLACCLMESAYSSGRATEPLLNTDAVLHEGFAYLVLARHNGDDFGLTAAELGLMPHATAVADAYENSTCPDCGHSIPTNAAEGSACTNCGHAFFSVHDSDADEIPMAAEARDLTLEHFAPALASLKRQAASAIRSASTAGDYSVTLTGIPFDDPRNDLRKELVKHLNSLGYICQDSSVVIDPALPRRTTLVIGWPKLDTPVVRRQGGRLVEAPLGGKVPDSNALTYTTGQGN